MGKKVCFFQSFSIKFKKSRLECIFFHFPSQQKYDLETGVL